MMEFREGKAVVKVPAFEKITSKSKVFYNPDMAFDRSLSLSVFKASQKLEICDAFSGSGIRAILYALEGGEVTANDANPCAYKLIQENAALNGVSLRVVHEDANILFRREKFEIIDADPFGSPARYLDSIMCGLKNDSLLFVTATDTEALCGYAQKAALRKYSMKTARTPFAKELGVRVLITAVMREGAKYGFGFSVLFSYWRKHYIRLFLRARWSKKAAFESMSMVNPLYFCRCGYFSIDIEKKCPFCGRKISCISPVYVGRVKDNEFLNLMESNALTEKVKNELDIPFYYDTHSLAKFHHVQPSKISEVIGRLEESGFSASRTIFCPTGVKTTASVEELLETMGSQ